MLNSKPERYISFSAEVVTGTNYLKILSTNESELNGMTIVFIESLYYQYFKIPIIRAPFMHKQILLEVRYYDRRSKTIKFTTNLTELDSTITEVKKLLKDKSTNLSKVKILLDQCSINFDMDLYDCTTRQDEVYSYLKTNLNFNTNGIHSIIIDGIGSTNLHVFHNDLLFWSSHYAILINDEKNNLYVLDPLFYTPYEKMFDVLPTLDQWVTKMKPEKNFTLIIRL